MSAPEARPKRPVMLDLGCGTAKCPGFVGADRFALSGVDFIADLDCPLPVRSDSVDLVVMSHALEHVHDLLDTLREVYRICRHGARVCVVAPYSNQALNLANPFHKHSFNEHTPRFWTDSLCTLVEPSEFSHPHASGWGLSRSDHDDPGIDFRCVSMEFFYFPEYRRLPRDEQRAARKKFLDVSDQIMYQLIVVKKDTSDDELQGLAHAAPYYEPPYVAMRKRGERIEALEAEMAGERSEAATVRAELAATLARLGGVDTELVAARQRGAAALEEAVATRQRLEQTGAELAATRGRVTQLEAELTAAIKQLEARSEELAGAERLLVKAHEDTAAAQEQRRQSNKTLSEALAQVMEMRERLHDARARVVETRKGLDRAEAELVEAHGQTRAAESRAGDAEARVQELSGRVEGTEHRLEHWRYAARAMRRELGPMRRRRLRRMLSRFRPGPDLLPQMNPAFQDLLDDGYLFLGSLRGYRLQPSEDVPAASAVVYSLTLHRPNLCGVLLAPIVDLPDETGSLGLELAGADGVSLARARVALSEIEPDRPVRFVFPPVPGSTQRLVLRVDVADAAAPVRLFEWRKRRWLGLRELRTRPFCAFIFDPA